MDVLQQMGGRLAVNVSLRCAAGTRSMGIAVTVLILSSVGAITVLASRSQNKQNTLPPKKHAGIIKIGFVLERNCFAKCGTAIPTKEIGPANATIHAERILERSTIAMRSPLTFTPRFFAYDSPS